MQQAAYISEKIKNFFTFNRIFICILLIAIFVRFWTLDLKLLHHDEAIHSWFSYELLAKGTWIYDPSYHGPFLYYVTAGMFSLFGDSDLVARLLPALFGTLLIPLVYCIYRIGYINKNQTLLTSLFIAISPDMVYFSLFLRHDIFMLFFTFLLLVALLYYFERGQIRFALIAAVAMAGALSCKEEMPVILLIFASFFIFATWRGTFTLPTSWKRDLVIGLILVTAIMSVLYTGFGAHPETLVGQNFQITVPGVHFETNTTGWYKAVEHWIDMHNQQRLGGPFYFYIPFYLLYELPIFILAIIGTLQFILKGIDLSLAFKRLKNIILTRKLSLTTGYLAEISLHQLLNPCPSYSKSDEFFRFCIYWMILTMAFYAYVGEKVPWLLIHQLLPMCFVAVYKLNWQKIAFALVGCIFLVVMTWHVAFIPVDINEPIVQVQNSEDMREVMKLIDASNNVVIASKDYWPLPWYYRGDRWKKIIFYGDRADVSALTEKNPGVIILHDTESYPVIEDYDKKTYKLSYWFSFYDNDKRLIDYYLNRDGKMGSINIDVFTLRKTV
ncbi:MAG: flippase activity-associated protein Agl23 [Methanoregula sp.]